MGAKKKKKFKLQTSFLAMSEQEVLGGRYVQEFMYQIS